MPECGMAGAPHILSPALKDWLNERRARLQAAGLAVEDADAMRLLDGMLLASDFAFAALLRDPALWATTRHPLPPAPVLAPDASEQWPALLRRYRVAGSLAMIAADVADPHAIEHVLRNTSKLADRCIAAALAAVQADMAQRHGTVCDHAGDPQSLVVFGLGKLGGRELNFSSDVDLVFAFPESGQSTGKRPLDAETWFARVGQQLIQLLDAVTADGFCYRVDMRLRPFGSSGRLALPFAAMEHYFQHEGRDWERYAWIKARPVAGDVAAGERLLDTLRPFVYRRYLDYGALDGLREMKALIAAEVERRDMAEHIKLGPGGIREIEFLVQALQLVRAGHEPQLRQRGLLAALQALADAAHFGNEVAARLATAYRFLRRLENRLQMLADQQTHQLPDDAFTRLRLATALGYPHWQALYDDLQQHRSVVSAEFERLLAPRKRTAKASALERYWRALPDGGDAEVLADAGFVDAQGADAAVRQFAASPVLRTLSTRGRTRLNRVLPALLHATGASSDPPTALPRLLSLLGAIVRRSSYLALLDEAPKALARLVDVIARSALLAEHLVQHPLLLDELLDARYVDLPPDESSLRSELARASAGLAADDTEERLRVLNEFRHALSFRIALAALAARQPAARSAQQLAWVAQVVVDAVLAMATADVAVNHGPAPGNGLAVLGYGSMGGNELGFASDLDLVFVYDAPVDAVSDGPRPLDAPRWYAKLVQKLVSLLSLPTPSGRLYEADLRLRPDGAGGLLVSSIARFAGYQRERAWAWEHQALVRARAIAGAASVLHTFEQTRAHTLRLPRDERTVADDVRQMRQRMRAELDRSTPGRFDLKHGEGGLVDLEFAVQAAVLAHAAHYPALVVPRDTAALIDAIHMAGIWDAACAEGAYQAHAWLLARSLECTLDGRPRILPLRDALDHARQQVRTACAALGLSF
ncbi:MAG: bifunctional [glutamate--ammonia ligase]-adenylyl-L-tyrosine phosphorylase/[glutamate--ammonia-ligase] adenylyltransferase [Lysobacterales bacterium CG17_big_fil_post_rev_8_21_14_2_50_64_11]|nr:MAG: bifunctional [glutamate--ammonia ligase]-adenylyl-L-tyrosine phosphorylase/[glutamate--ammonia-ligase] adenylyltransferase [Xanthomonadales bacterium CG17_big_fil_post_rev_8_21_14_2_50_64_11]